MATNGSGAWERYGRALHAAMAEVLIDPRRAVTMVEGLPDDSGLDRALPKNTARRLAAEILGKHGDDRWQTARQWSALLLMPEGSDL